MWPICSASTQLVCTMASANALHIAKGIHTSLLHSRHVLAEFEGPISFKRDCQRNNLMSVKCVFGSIFRNRRPAGIMRRID